MPSADSLALLARWRDGQDQQAAAEIAGRYLPRLLDLTRGRLSPKLRARLDPEDVAQSAFGSFFVRIRDGRLTIGEGTELWGLLASIAMHKLGHHVERHVYAVRRSVSAEQHFGGADSLNAVVPGAADAGASPDEAAALADQLENLYAGLEPAYARVVDLWLQGYGLRDSAQILGKGEQWVTRARRKLRGELVRQLS